MTAGGLSLLPGEAVPTGSIPVLPPEDFAGEITGRIGRGDWLAALFGAPGTGTPMVYAVLASSREGALRVIACVPGAAYPALTPGCPQAHWFERALHERWGIEPVGHPWLKPVRFPGAGAATGLTEFYRVGGEDVHEVAVGPVHAGVIEPGHFRFQCHGERVLHLEISLGYQHRGVTRALAGGPHPRTAHHMETLAGDTSVGHATAWSQVQEALADSPPPDRALALRAVALELERLANHTGDLGALAGDVAFLPTASYCGRLRGDLLGMTALLCGSRLGRGLVRPGGVMFDAAPEQIAELLGRLDAALRDLTGAVRLLLEAGSVQARFEGTGRLSRETALALGIVGPAARASGLARDARADFPGGWYRRIPVLSAGESAGDVMARARIRWLEINESVAFIRQTLGDLPAGDVRVPVAAPRPGRFAVSLVEGWRGPICHAALTGPDSRYAHYEVVDPSVHNWQGLAHAMRGQEISDFPVCNKSFNLSYSGHDL